VAQTFVISKPESKVILNVSCFHLALYFDPFPAFDHNALLLDAKAEAQT
jgi:hypothetical protein